MLQPRQAMGVRPIIFILRDGIRCRSLFGALSFFRSSSRLTFDLVALFEGRLSYPRHTFLERVQVMHCGLPSSHKMCRFLQNAAGPGTLPIHVTFAIESHIHIGSFV